MKIIIKKIFCFLFVLILFSNKYYDYNISVPSNLLSSREGPIVPYIQ